MDMPTLEESAMEEAVLTNSFCWSVKEAVETIMPLVQGIEDLGWWKTQMDYVSKTSVARC